MPAEASPWRKAFRSFRTRDAYAAMRRRYRGDEMQGFLSSPRVKFTLKLLSYLCFLGLYVMTLNQDRGRPHLGGLRSA